MTLSATLLRELHRIHRQLSDLRDRQSRGPRQIKAMQIGVEKVGADHEAAKETLKQARMASDEKQLQLKSREDRIADLQAKLNTANSNKEYQTLKEQIAADQQANSVLSDEILEILERIDTLVEEVKQAEQKHNAALEEYKKVEARVAEEQKVVESELTRVTAQLEESEKQLPADFREDYRRMTKGRGEDAMAQVDGEVCGTCFQVLSPQTMNELFMEKPVFCKSCGAVLYLPEDRQVK